MTKPSSVRTRARLKRAAFLAAGTVVPLAWLSCGPALGAVPHRPVDSAAPTRTYQVGDSAEAWYAAAPVDLCTTPLGCPPPQVPSSPYPADTLHVGAAAGRETARLYVVPDLSAIPYDATPVAGTMRLPVAAATGDGTVSPDAAKLVACLTTAPVSDKTEGSSAAPPATSCATRATPTYDAETGIVSVDLQPFLSAWSAGTVNYGIALLPDTAKAQPTDTWHVTVNGRSRPRAKHVTSTVVVRPAPPADGSVTADDPPPPADSGQQLPGQPTAPDVPAPPAAGAPAPPAQSPVVAPQQPAVPQAQPVALSREFQYPMAFLLPLALLAGAVFFVRLFTRDATPMRPRA